MEETRELAVVSDTESPSFAEWYPKASGGMKTMIAEGFNKEGFEIFSLLSETVHREFGYDQIPRLATQEEQALFENAILTLDVAQLYYTSIQFETARVAATLAFSDEISQLEAGQQVASFFALSARINREIAAIRLLLFNDLAVQAVGRARSYLECFEALMLTSIDPSFAGDFSNAVSPEQSKHVFFKYLSKSKAKKKIIKSLPSPESFTRLEELSSDFISEFGTAVHPSFRSTLENVFSDMEALANSEEFLLRGISLGFAQRFSMLVYSQLLLLITEPYRKVILPMISELNLNMPVDLGSRSLRNFAKNTKDAIVIPPLAFNAYSIQELSKHDK